MIKGRRNENMSMIGEMGCVEVGNILFLGKRFYTNKDVLKEHFGRIFHLPNEWVKSGQKVLLWLIDYHSGSSVDTQIEGMRVVSTPVPSIAMIGVAFRAARGFRPRLIVASGDCYIGLLGWLLACITRASFVFDVYDKYDEFEGYIKPIGFDLFNFLIRRSSLHFYASRALAVRFASNASINKTQVVPNGVNIQAFRPMDMMHCREILGLQKTSTLIGYFGGMEPDRGVMDLIGAVELLRLKNANVMLLLCGKSHPSIPLHYDWIIYRGIVPHEEMPFYINASDVLIVPYRLSEFMDMGASCKIAEYLMCQRPIVSTTTPNFISNFPIQTLELGTGFCRPSDIQDMARAISYQLQHQMLVTIPSGLTWSEIAEKALDAIRVKIKKDL